MRILWIRSRIRIPQHCCNDKTYAGKTARRLTTRSVNHFWIFENLDIVPLIRMDLQCLQLVIIKIVMIDCKNARVFRKRLGYSPFFHGVNTTPHGLQLRVLYVLEVLKKRKTVNNIFLIQRHATKTMLSLWIRIRLSGSAN